MKFTKKCEMCKEKRVLIEKYIYKRDNLFKDAQNSIQNENMPGRPTMVDSVNMLLLADKRVKTEDISESLGIYVGTVHKIVHDDLAFLRSVVVRFHPENARPHTLAPTVEITRQFS